MNSGHSNSAAHYLSVAAVIVESSAIYTIWGIIFIGLYIVHNPIQFVFLGTLSAVQVSCALFLDDHDSQVTLGYCSPPHHLPRHSWNGLASIHYTRDDFDFVDDIAFKSRKRRQGVGCES